MKLSVVRITVPLLLGLLLGSQLANGQVSDQQLERLLRRFPAADRDGDGRLTMDEARAHRQKRQRSDRQQEPRVSGAPHDFHVDPGWQEDRFPDQAVCYLSPEEIAAIHAEVAGGRHDALRSNPKPTDGSLRIVGTGHSFMGPGYKTFPAIAEAAGFEQQVLLTHTGGGVTGSARYKWEQENGIFQFDGQPKPKLLSAIANGEWDAMMWGPYYQDRPAYYACWIDFCLQYNPQMTFYLSDAWPQLGQLDHVPTSEDKLTADVFHRLGRERHETASELIHELNERHPDKVFVMPTSDAMVLAVQYYHRGELPGVEGIHKAVGKKDRSLWRDILGHLGPGLGRLEGYVFYATLYGRSPELIEGELRLENASDYPSRELDRVFRKIAWEAVLRNPLSGVTDENGNGIDDDLNP